MLTRAAALTLALGSPGGQIGSPNGSAFGSPISRDEEEEDEPEHPSSDGDLQHLLTTINNVSCVEYLDSGKDENELPEDKLFRTIQRVMSDRREQFVNYRLQWLVFEYRRKDPSLFELPDPISSPRMVQDYITREAWWYHARRAPDVLRKYGNSSGSLDDGLSPDGLSPRSETSASVRGSAIKSDRKDIKKARDLQVSIAKEQALRLGDLKEASSLVMKADALYGMSAPKSGGLLRSASGVSCHTPLAGRGSSESKANPFSKSFEKRSRIEARRFGVPQLHHHKHQAMEINVSGEKKTVMPSGTLDKCEHDIELSLQPMIEKTQPHLARIDTDVFGGNARQLGTVARQGLKASNSVPHLAEIIADEMGGFGHGVLGEEVIPHMTRPRQKQVLSEDRQSLREEAEIEEGQVEEEQSRRKSDKKLTSHIDGHRRALQQNMQLSSLHVAEEHLKCLDDVRGVTGSLRWGTSRWFSGVADLEPPPMTPMSFNNMGFNLPRDHPFNFHKVGLTNKNKERKRNDGGLGIAISERTWSDDFIKDCTLCPKPTTKIAPVASRQRRLDAVVDQILDGGVTLSKKESKNTMTSKTKIGSKSAGALPVAYTSEGALTRTRSAPGGPVISRSPAWMCAAPVITVDSNAPFYQNIIGDRRRPPHAVGIFEPQGAAKSKRAANAYMDEVESLKMLPKIAKCLQIVRQPDPNDEDGTEDVPASLDIQHLNLTDAEAKPLIKGLLEHQMSFDQMLLAGNPRLSDTILLHFFRLVAKRSKVTGVKIQRLDLSGAVGLGELSLRMLGVLLAGEMKDLKFLRLDGIAVSEHTWQKVLQPSMHSLFRLEELSLADMQIGRASQVAPTIVSELLPGLRALRVFDISSNFFGFQGCKALAQNIDGHPALATLDLSHNAGGFLGGVCGFAGADKCTTLSAPGQLHRFNPISLVCEGIAFAPFLKSLKLANCQLNYDEDFILEDAFAEKVGSVGMEELDLSCNPCQGQMGARCLLRLAIATTTLTTLDVREFRETLSPENSVAYEYTDPSQIYTLDLSYPQHRALFRSLMRRCKGFKEDPMAVFHFEDFGPVMVAFGETAIKGYLAGRGLPDAGELKFRFSLPSCISHEDQDIVSLMNRIGRRRKIPVTLFAFVRLADLFKNLRDTHSRRVLIGAVAADLLMKICHVRYLSALDHSIRLEVIVRLIPAVHNLDRMSGFTLVQSARGTGAVPMHIGCAASLRLLLFNASCANAHYDLDMANASDRRLLEHLLIINEWERARAEAAKYADLSQHGGHECLRNVRINGIYTQWESENTTMPARGEMVFDFCSPFHAPIDTPTTEDYVLDHIVNALNQSACNAAPKTAVMRGILHRLILTPQQCARLLETLPGSSARADARSASSARLSPRVDAFTALYTRCVDIQNLLSAEPFGLYGMVLLTRNEVLNVRIRLGRLRTWDLTRVDHEFLVPGRPEFLMLPAKTRQEDAEKDLRESLGTVRGVGLRDDVTSRGNASRYVLDLTVLEDWLAACVMMQLAKREGGSEHWAAASWSETAQQEARGTRFLVPESWTTNLPTVGIFTGTYFLELSVEPSLEFRNELATKYLGW